jgi:hypothetical protein
VATSEIANVSQGFQPDAGSRFTHALRLSGTLPPLSASFVMTCFCSYDAGTAADWIASAIKEGPGPASTTTGRAAVFRL